MRIARVFCVAWGLCCLPEVALAQWQTQVHAGGGLAGPGDNEGWAWQFNVAGERVNWRGVMIGQDLAVLFRRTSPRPGRPDGEPFQQIVGSFYVGAHVPPARTRRAARVEPIVGAGIALVVPYFGWELRGGAIVWMSDRLGVRLDARLLRAFAGEGGLIMVGAGVAFRRNAQK